MSGTMDVKCVMLMFLVVYLISDVQGSDGPSNVRQSDNGRVWSKWLPCNVSCGEGWQSRICLKGVKACDGRRTQRRKCNRRPCPVPEDGKWSQWQSFSQCEGIPDTDPCMGIQRSVRTCDGLQAGSKYCRGCNSRVMPCSLC